MPGLIKVGKTTKSPNQRKDELHSTGVPVPFELECAFEVDNCSDREKKAHAALAKYRLERREFFEISVELALRKILPVLGDYTVFKAKDDYAIEQLAEKIRQHEAANRLNAERQREQRQEQALAAQEQRRRRVEIERRLLMEESDVRTWYRQEYARLFPKSSILLFSLPVAIFALLLVPMVMPKLTYAGVLFTAALVSWIGGALLKSWHDQKRANSVERCSLDEAFANRLSAVRHMVLTCPNCGQQLRIQRVQVIENEIGDGWKWNCPRFLDRIYFDANESNFIC
jgi:hypothetical protein